MKLRSIISTVTATLAVGAMATADYSAGNMFARLPVSGAPASAIIALPFSGCGEPTMEIYVTNLVMTTNLDAGDTLLYKDDGGTWRGWQINSSHEWESIATSDPRTGISVTPPAEQFKIVCGKACWLNRQTPSKTFYLYGQVNASKTNVTVAAGTASGPTYTIVGCPWETGTFNVTTIVGSEGDTVLLMDSSSGNKSGKIEYTYHNNAWMKKTYTSGSGVTIGTITIPSSGTEVYEEVGSGDPKTVPAGLGFMYGRKATSPLMIQWGN